MSAIPAQKLREAVMQILFSVAVATPAQESLEELLSKELGIPKRSVADAWNRAMLISEQISTLDEHLAKSVLHYDFARVSALEKIILRLGCYELLVDETIPPKVAIAEAVRLARKFSSPQAAAFVNAILDAVYRKSIGEPIDESTLQSSIVELQRSQEIAESASQDDATSRQEGLED